LDGISAPADFCRADGQRRQDGIDNLQCSDVNQVLAIRIFTTEKDSMEPALNIPIDVNAVELSTWEAAADIDSRQITLQHPAAKSPSTVVVNLPEQVTAKESRTLIRDFRDQLTNDQPVVILDMSEVKEMDTAGLDLLLECLKETVRRDGIIRVRGISPEAATILELTGMDHVVGLVPESALPEPEAAADSLLLNLPNSQQSLVS
jgi:anti-anti-sigma factor